MNTMTANRKCRFLFSFIIVLYATCIYSQERPKMERFLTVKPTSASFGAEGGSKTFTVSASGTWKISSNSRSWIHLSKDGNSLNLRVDENSGISSRSGSFELVAGEKKVRVSVTQSGGDVSLSVSSDDMYFNASGGTKTVTVTTNGTWQIGSNTTSWGHVSKNGNQLSIRADRNNSSSQRSGSVVIKAGNKEKRVYISQSGSSVSQNNLTVSSDNLQFDSYGGTKTITITSSGAWQVGTNIASWGHLTKSGNQLSIKIDRNSTTTSRSDWFTVKMGNKEKRINVSQSGSSPNLSISSENLSFSSVGGTQTLTISTNGTWQIGTNTASWGHLTKNGNQLSVKIDRNSSKDSRNDWFSIKAGNIEKKIRISQEGMPSSLSVSSNKLDFSSYGGSQTITVNSNSDWRVSLGTRPWGHLTKYGNSLSVRVDRNKKKTSRTDYFRLKADDKEVQVNIYQSGRYRRPFNHAVDNYAGGISVGYIQKQWEYNEGGEKTKVGVFEDDKYLQGIQAGIRIDPQFGAGFGLNTGIFYEYCWAKSNNNYDEYGSYDLSYKEHGLYMPLHLKFTMNFSKWFQLSVYGGAGLNYVLSGKAYLDADGDSYDWNVFKEEENWKKFNTMLEYGASLRINAVQFDFTMSKGLTNWSENSDYDIKVGRPMSVSATICF